MTRLRPLSVLDWVLVCVAVLPALYLAQSARANLPCPNSMIDANTVCDTVPDTRASCDFQTPGGCNGQTVYQKVAAVLDLGVGWKCVTVAGSGTTCYLVVTDTGIAVTWDCAYAFDCSWDNNTGCVGTRNPDKDGYAKLYEMDWCP